MLITIDTTSGVALWSQVAASIRADMAAGRLKPGDRLSPARELAAALGVNLHTVLRAYQALRDDGLVDMRRGRGATVTNAGDVLAELRDDIRALTIRANGLGISADALASIIKETRS